MDEGDPTIYVGGCRAQSGGIHWGHVYGSFVGVPSRTAPDQYFFVISDGVGPRPESEAETLRTARELFAFARVSERSFTVVRESDLRARLTQLVLRFERAVPLSWLQKHHPHRSALRSGSYLGTIGDLMFPVHQAAYLLGLGAVHACYNDDNDFVVNFTRDVARRVDPGGQVLRRPRTVRKIPPHLPGANGRRMCKGNQNTLPVLADDAKIHRYIRSVVGRELGSRPPSPADVTDFEVSFGELIPSLSKVTWSLPDIRDRIEAISGAVCEMVGAVQSEALSISDRDANGLLDSGKRSAFTCIDEVLGRLV